MNAAPSSLPPDFAVRHCNKIRASAQGRAASPAKRRSRIFLDQAPIAPDGLIKRFSGVASGHYRTLITGEISC